MAAIKFKHILLIALALALMLIGSLSTLYTDFLWFKALEFQSIFTTILISKVGLFFAGFIGFFIFAMINYSIAAKSERESSIGFKTAALAFFVASIFVGFITSEAWFTILQFLNRTSFGLSDPILFKDVSFYVFTLPFLNQIWIFAFATIAITTFLISAYYLQNYLKQLFMGQYTTNAGTPDMKVVMPGMPKLGKFAKNHIFVLLSFNFILVAVRYYLARYSVMYSREGIVVGAGFTDVNVFLPVVQLLMVLAIAVAAIFYLYIFFIARRPKLRKRHILLYILTLYFIVAAIGQGVAPALVQSLKVDPNELNLEAPYIDNNIEFTRLAYGLDKIEERDFEVTGNLSRDDIEESDTTVDNIRILDYRPLTQTYKQTQEIRLYYDLSSIDIDRYNIDGKYTQVMLAPRELNQNSIVDNAKTWVNLHMVYSHGFGYVMSPVNSITKEGLPDYLVKDIPPIYNVDEPSIRIDEPRIYYGQKDNNYIVVDTNTEEFDYPKGSTNEYISYDGEGGVKIEGFFNKVMMALRFGDIKLLLSADIKDSSKIMFRRNIQSRISEVMPFLLLDRDPYITIVDGKMYWIQDAYSTTGNYPYSEKISYDINYIRNSVKIVMDAYNGDLEFYIFDDEDPLVQTYDKIFPGVFKSHTEMNPELKKHVRYPEDLFRIQSAIFSTYHMDNTNVFYNKEDAWETPVEIYGTGQQIAMEPYYMVTQLPGEDEPEFIIMIPFTPLRKDNMIAWLSGRSDGDDYGKLFLYKFPKDKLIYGPSQIEAKIDQDSVISQQLTLWSQQGSRVTRGNLLVIPVKDSLLYVEPLYIQAEQGQLPELKRVIVSDGEKVVMEETLSKSLDALFGEASVIIDVDAPVSDSSLGTQANEYYQEILESMESGDWTSFGENFDKLGVILDKME